MCPSPAHKVFITERLQLAAKGFESDDAFERSVASAEQRAHFASGRAMQSLARASKSMGSKSMSGLASLINSASDRIHRSKEVRLRHWIRIPACPLSKVQLSCCGEPNCCSGGQRGGLDRGLA
jgi:hypothetical protein